MRARSFGTMDGRSAWMLYRNLELRTLRRVRRPTDPAGNTRGNILDDSRPSTLSGRSRTSATPVGSPRGCTHRDIKPHNILRFGERWVLGDLGIVQWSDLNEEFTSAATIDDPLMMSTREVMSTRLESRGTRC